MKPEEVRKRASEVSKKIRETENPEEWHQLATELVPVLTAYWDVHPHSAMEMLEVASFALPLPLAHATVRRVAQGWRKKETYDPCAGGSADHCYLSALILSENFDLAEEPWVEQVLPGTLSKELNYPRFERMRDGQLKRALVQGVADRAGWVPRSR